MRIEALDPNDSAQVEAAVALLGAAHPVDFPDDPAFAPSWERGMYVHPLPGATYEHYRAHDGDGRLLGVLSLELPMLDNVDTAMVWLTAHPDARRAGVGTALANHARERALALGRKRLGTFALNAGAVKPFLDQLGFQHLLVNHRQRLFVTPERQASWKELRAEVEPHAAGYRLEYWRGVTPTEYADGLAYLEHRLSTDAPLDDLQWEAEDWDAARVQEHDRAMLAWGRRMYTTAAIHEASGNVAGYTSLAYPVEDPTHAWQWNTIVDADHRGHRLGTLLKVANHAFAFEREPDTRTVFTFNAQSNKHMNAINTALGFTPLDYWAESQLELGPA